ncbi:hypothetical protein B0H66DRAFT_603510 [Apodospora peruviana]|uniref:(S)-ureidoglycine aminohydrolase cupin domain-containing protein n=1 Tax=Apodospora peruviana TaxID=516989 RepID=A0AAE0M4I5_9PEZI|nr:hypothetical protein B0H66DRAFT_603510 [Apodospora peruviana]
MSSSVSSPVQGRRATQQPQTQPPLLLSPGRMQSDPVEIFEMEDWEVAPGRIREQASVSAENIAFSKPYLSETNKDVPVCEDVTFRIDTIRAGQAWELEPHALKTRMCSVAAGKVRVKIGEEPEFTIGPHGMFKVKDGVPCTVRNWMYVDAVLHVTSLSGFP